MTDHADTRACPCTPCNCESCACAAAARPTCGCTGDCACKPEAARQAA